MEWPPWSCWHLEFGTKGSGLFTRTGLWVKYTWAIIDTGKNFFLISLACILANFLTYTFFYQLSIGTAL